jgi:hypothetical protein
MYPNRLFILLIIGILWEIFEMKIGKIKLNDKVHLKMKNQIIS